MPELGRPPAGGDRATLWEALRWALESIGQLALAALGEKVDIRLGRRAV